MKFIDSTSIKILFWILRVVASIVGLTLIPWGVLGLRLAACHDSGGFCAGELNPWYYVVGVGCFLSGMALLAWAFTASWKKSGIVVIAFAVVAALWIVLAETHN